MPSEYILTDTELTGIADSIRDAGGITGLLEFPSGYIGAVETTGLGVDNYRKVISGDSSNYSFFDSAVTTIGEYAFYRCDQLTSVSFPACTTISSYAFYNCTNLTTAIFSACTTIHFSAFYNCRQLSTVSFPECSLISANAFYSCWYMTTASFPACYRIEHDAFVHCHRLTKLYLMGSHVVALGSTDVFTSTPIGGYTNYTSGTYGSIYVPASLLTTYKRTQAWSVFSSRFKGI